MKGGLLPTWEDRTHLDGWIGGFVVSLTGQSQVKKKLQWVWLMRLVSSMALEVMLQHYSCSLGSHLETLEMCKRTCTPVPVLSH